MGECRLDHSLEDTMKKFESQSVFLPLEIKSALTNYLIKDLSQSKLNDIFHLLKKYDLAAPEEREERNKKFLKILGESQE